MKNPPRALLAALFKPAVLAAANTPRHVLPASLPAPRVPANHTGGINKDHVESGEVPVVIPIYFGIELDVPVVLYLNDVEVDRDIVQSDTQSLFLYIDAADLPRGDSQNVVHYHAFTGFMGVNEEASHPVSLRIKTLVPGDPPADPADPEVNPGLAAPLNVPAVIVDPDVLPVIPVAIPAYTNMAEGDVITLFWGGAGVVAPPLTAAQVGTTVTIDVPKDIVIARPGTGVVVRYHVYDAVRNYSLFSASALSDVSPIGTLDEPFIVREVGGVLNMDQLAGSDIDIVLFKGPLDPAAQVTLHFAGQPPDWPYLDYTLGPVPVGSASRLTFTVPNTLGLSLVDSEVFVYCLAVTGSTVQRSKSARAQVIGTPFELPAPQVPLATGGKLDADDITGSTFSVTVPANEAFIHDTQIELVWEGFSGAGDRFVHAVTMAVVQPTYPLTFTAQKAWVQEIPGGTVSLHYNLVVAGNSVVEYRSEPLPLDVAGEAALLPLPRFQPALSAEDELNFDRLAGPFNVIVDITNPDFVGGVLHVHWLGQSVSDVIDTPIAALGALATVIPRSLIDPNLDQVVDVWYDITRADGPPGRSEQKLLTVINDASLPWPAAEVWDASGANVDPLNPIDPATGNANSATVVVLNPRLKDGDLVRVMWRLPNGTTAPFEWVSAAAGEARIPVAVSTLAASLGQTIKLSYVVLVGGVTPEVSIERDLSVLAMPASALKAPQVEQAPATDLDLNSFTSDGSVLVEPWPLMALGQPFWLTVSGTRDDGEAYSERLPAPYTVQSGDLAGGIRRPLPRATLLRLENATEFTVQLNVGFAATTPEAEAIIFPEKKLNVVQLALTLPAPAVAGVVNDRLDLADIPAEGVKITAAYTGQAVGQWVSAHWVGVTAALSQDFPAVQVTNASTALEFTVPKVKAEASLFKAVSVVYQVARTQGAMKEASVALPFEVQWPKGRYENFESFTVGDVDKLQLDGITLKRKWAGKLQISDSTVGAGAGIKGKSARALPTPGKYTAIDIFFDVPLASFSAVVFGAAQAVYEYVDGSTSSVLMRDGYYSFFKGALPGKTIESIYIYKSYMGEPDAGSLYIDEILWSV